MGNLEGKKLLGRHRLRWDNNIKIALKEREGEGVDWIDLAENREK